MRQRQENEKHQDTCTSVHVAIYFLDEKGKDQTDQ